MVKLGWRCGRLLHFLPSNSTHPSSPFNSTFIRPLSRRRKPLLWRNPAGRSRESGVASLPVESGTKPSRRQFLRARTLIWNLGATYNGTVRTRNTDSGALLWKEVGARRTQIRRVPLRSTVDLGSQKPCYTRFYNTRWWPLVRQLLLSVQCREKTRGNLRRVLSVTGVTGCSLLPCKALPATLRLVDSYTRFIRPNVTNISIYRDTASKVHFLSKRAERP